jgi:CDP-paratose 2-epimerase
MQVLITGGVGFIGSHVAEFYMRRGDDVIVFDNLKRGEILGKDVGESSKENWNYLKSLGKIKLTVGDVRNFEQLKTAAKECQLIVHTAAQVAVTTSVTDPRTDFEINALGTFNVEEAARLNDSALIYSSTNKVYGDNVNLIPVDERESYYQYSDEKYVKGIPEDFPIDLTHHSPYGSSKLAADISVQDYSYTYGLRTAVFRQSCIYGERQYGVEDQGWVAWFAIALLTNKQISIYGNGKQVRDVLYVGDLVEAYHAFQTSNLRHGVFNIGGGPDNTLSLLQLLDMLEHSTGLKPTLEYKDWRPADQRVYVSDISKCYKLLGWRPKVNPKQGVTKLVDWISHNKDKFVPS